MEADDIVQVTKGWVIINFNGMYHGSHCNNSKLLCKTLLASPGRPWRNAVSSAKRRGFCCFCVLMLVDQSCFSSRCTPKYWLSCIFLILASTKDIDFSGLNDILALPISFFLTPVRIHQPPGTNSVVTLRSSMKVQIGGWWIPDLDLEPLHSGSVDFTIMFIARANRITSMVQSAMIPTSSLCHCDVVDHVETLGLKSL